MNCRDCKYFESYDSRQRDVLNWDGTCNLLDNDSKAPGLLAKAICDEDRGSLVVKEQFGCVMGESE